MPVMVRHYAAIAGAATTVKQEIAAPGQICSTRKLVIPAKAGIQISPSNQAVNFD
jgi:hypothetical protein